jgi:N6-adenosine-specific RNA methylase IME4
MSEILQAPHPFAGLRKNYYRGVLIDPPTAYIAGTKSRPQHYIRMSDRGIAALPVQDLLHPDGAWIGLWVTSPKLYKPMGSKVRLRPDELADAWDCVYSARGWVWVKLRKRAKPHGPWYPADLHRGQGQTTGKNAEDCLLFRYKKAPLKSRKGFEPILAPLREHSRKPDAIYDQFELALHGPYCELFARQRVERPDWDSWGDQVDLFQPAAMPLLEQRIAA